MSRILNLVRLDADNVPVAGCTGSCHQGHAACDCELAAWIAPDPDRVIKAPPPKSEPNHRARAASWAIAVTVFLYLGLAALLGIDGRRLLP